MHKQTAAGRGGTNGQIVQGVIMDHLGTQTASSSSHPLGLSSAMTADNPSSSLTELYPQSGVHDDYTSFLHGQVESPAQSYLVAQEHNSNSQEASRRRKRRLDKERKKRYRVDGKQAYARICELLEIDFMPENNRGQRSKRLSIDPRLEY